MAKKNQPKKAVKASGFFVSVSNPDEFRYAILDSRKSVLESLKLVQTLKELRQKKAEEKSKLRKQVRHISLVLSKIKSLMPTINVPQEKKPEPKPVEAKPKEEPRPAHRTELDRIDKQIQDIDSKIKYLNQG